LKHIERTGVLLHLLDIYRLDKVFSDYTDIRKELEYFSKDLAKKEEILVFSKADLLDKEMKDHIVSEFKKLHKKKKIFVISAATGEGIEELKDYLIDNYSTPIPQSLSPSQGEREEEKEVKFFDLKENSDPKKVEVKYL
jgi:GTP-binding protein